MEKSLIYLRGLTGKAEQAELWDDITDEHIKLWANSWVPEFIAATKRLKKRKSTDQNIPQGLNWHWGDTIRNTRQYLTYRRFSILAEEKLQGLMLVNLSANARIPSQFGKDLVYMDLVSTAPWNRKDEVNPTPPPRFSGIGLTMIRVAIELSRAEGLSGRIGLHSVKEAERFYRDSCKMTDLGLDLTKKMTYFEMTEIQADVFTN